MARIPERLAALRQHIVGSGLSHYLVPSSDEHLNEYPPAWRQRRQWVSGFTGSAGDLLVGLSADETWLFTDGRYHLQAEAELRGTGIGLQKVGTPQATTLRQMLAELARLHGKLFVVGYDPMVLPATIADECGKAVSEGGGVWRAVPGNLVDVCWLERPNPPTDPLMQCPSSWSTRTPSEKIQELRRELVRHHVDALVTLKLDQIAWLTNLRATHDIPFNPVFEACLCVLPQEVHLFLHGGAVRLPEDYTAQIPTLRVHPYDEFTKFLTQLEACAVMVDPDTTSSGVLAGLERNPAVRVIRGTNPIEDAKAVKDEAEGERMAHASLLASAAKVRAFFWLQERIEAGIPVTERSFRTRLEAFYRELPGYQQLSFATIAATGGHAAVVHYGTADDTVLATGDLFLVDSGVQLAGGTTDDTRTVAVGPPSPEQRRLFTLVLKAHISGARQFFPEDTPGAAIDALVRAPLWQEGLNYDHGTGHGVGAFLNVHEGPFALAEGKRRPQGHRSLKAGMITSIEPGIYRPRFGGIRLENLYRIAERTVDPDGTQWLGFEPLTWIPFDARLIDRAALTPGERTWLDAYHAGCLERLQPWLQPAERRWLAASLQS